MCVRVGVPCSPVFVSLYQGRFELAKAIDYILAILDNLVSIVDTVDYAIETKVNTIQGGGRKACLIRWLRAAIVEDTVVSS